MSQVDVEEIVATLRESILVLTEDLCIDYASQRFCETFRVSATDTLGQRLADLGNGQWNIPALLNILRSVIADGISLEGFEVEHQFEDIGRRIMRLNARKITKPDNRSLRVLLAIEDVSVAVDTQRELDRQQRVAKGIVDTLREPFLLLDGELRVIDASRMFYKTFHVGEAEVVGVPLAAICEGGWAIPELISLLEMVIPEHESVEHFEVRRVFPKIGERTFIINARKIFREGNNTRTLLLAMQDVTDIRRIETDRARALRHAERLLEELNHRVMNSLSMIGSVIALEARNLSDDQCRHAFERMRGRISSIAALYRNLTRTRAAEVVQLDEYLRAVTEDMISGTKPEDFKLQVELDLSALPITSAIAIPIGLIVSGTMAMGSTRTLV
jgi:nitrogen-specific signal transduction histidine kinase